MAAPDKEGEAQKLRFGQWLLNAINSGRYPGLRWIDPARGIFRVPWKHNARKDITSSDVEVFQAWARISGRYEEGSEDPAKWKTNFRCALRSTHMFKLEEDNSKHGDDPHKVFSVVSGEPCPMEGLCWVQWAISGPPILGALLSANLHHTGANFVAVRHPTLCSPLGSTDSTQLKILEELLQQCDISPDLGSLDPSWVPAGGTSSAHGVQGCCFPPTTFSEWVPTVEQPPLDTYQPTGLLPPGDTGAMPVPCHLTEGTVPMQYGAEAALFVPAPNGIVSILDVTIYYRGREFHREVVGSSCCLLTYQPPSLEAPCPWHVVHFPSPASVADGKQRHMTEQLLDVAELRLEQRAYKVFASRWKKCRVFWALSQQLEGVEEPPPNLICRDQETPIFDFNEFCTELRDFRNGQRRRSPDFTIYLCFGQAFSKDKPKESKLILVKLVPKFCEYYYEQVLQEGASSLDSHSISLQLSNSFDLMELIEQYNMQLG
uniref:Interferon regulatory factor 7 n=1 Tax=Zosterops lateralis melanops TaxID=1220523 RepID=A0A8D2PWU6_ZOSLA